MNSLWFCLGAALFFTVFFAWGFRVLPREDWQFLAILPKKRLSDGVWEGQNLTFYGVFNAVAHVIALLFLGAALLVMGILATTIRTASNKPAAAA